MKDKINKQQYLYFISNSRVIILVTFLITVLLLSITVKGCFKREKPGPQSGSSAPLPGAFQTILPADGVINVDVFSASVPVAWNASNNATSYILEVSKEDDFTPANMVYSATLGPSITSHSVTYGTLWGGIWYYWRVKAVNAYGTTVSSDAPSCFYTSPDGIIPGVFNLAAPIDNDSGLYLTPELNWTNAPKESKYIIYLDNDSNFSSPIYTDTARPGELGIQIPSSAGLTETSRYYWKVDAYNPFGTRSPSIYSFVTGPIKYYTLTTDTGNINAGQGITATLTALDNNSLPVTNHSPFTITMNAATGLTYYNNNTLTTINTSGIYTVTNGIARIYLKATKSEEVVITATDRALRSVSTGPITVSPGAASNLLWVTAPATPQAVGTVWAPFSVEVTDAYNNRLTSDNSTIVTLSVVTGTSTFATGLTATASAGLAAFSTSSYNKVETINIRGSAVALSATTTTGNIVVTIGAAAKLFWVTAPGTAQTAGTNWTTFTVEVTDVYNNRRTSDNSTVVILSVVTGTSAFATGLTATASAGLATFSNTSYSNAGTVNIKAIATGLADTTTTGDITVNPGAATKLLWVTAPATAQTAGANWAPFAVEVTDAYNNRRTLDNSTVLTVTRVAGTGSFAGAYTATASAGVATFSSALYNKAETITVKATAAGLADTSTTGNIAVNPGTAAKLLWVTGPATPQTAGTPWPTSSIRITDQYDNTVNSSAAVTLTIVAGTGSFAAGYTATASAGLATFSSALYNKAETITVKGTAAPLADTATTGNIVINPGAGNTIAFSSQPANSVAGATMADIVVNLKDVYNNNISGTAVTLTLSPTGVTTLGGTLTRATNISGNAAFDNLVITLTGTYGLTATAGALTTASGNFNITAATPNIVVFSAQPLNTVAGAILTNVVVNLKDSYNNSISDTAVTLTLSPTGVTTLGGTLTRATNISGNATFDNLVITLTGTYGLTATAGSFNTASNPFTITPAAVNTLVFSTQPPASVGAGGPFTTEVTVTDQYGNPISGSPVSITTTTQLNGTTTTNTNSSGLAIFSGLSITTSGTYALTATALGVYPDVMSGLFNITPAPANTLTFSTQPPASATAGATTIAAQVTVRDVYNNLVPSVPVSLTTTTQLNGTTTTNTDSSGVAIFSGLSITTTGTYALTATASTLYAPPSTLFNITPAAANTLTFSTQPSDTVAGATTIAAQVTVRDAYNNLVPSVPVSLTTTTQLNGTTTTNTNSSGVAIFSGLSITTSGAYALTATAGTLNTASNPFTITPAAAASLTFSTQPSNTTAGVIMDDVVVNVRDQYNNNISGTAVALTTTDGTLLSGQLTWVTNISGNATFNDLSMNLVGTYALTATAGSVNTASTNFNITPVGPSTITFSAQPANTSAGAMMANVVVNVKDQFNNNISGTTVTLTLSPTGAATLGGTLTRVTNISGNAAFNDLYMTLVGTYALTATASPVNVLSNPFNVAPDIADRLVFTVQPGSTTVGNGFTPSVSVTVRDAYGNTRTSDTNSITIAGTGLTVGGTNPRNASSGIATFSDLTVGGAANNYQLVASAGGLTGATSISFSLTGYGPANNLIFLQQPGNTVSGAAFAPTLTVRIRDAYNNIVGNATNPVSITVSAGSAFSGTTIGVPAASGVVTFTGVSISGTGTSRVLTATASGLTSSTSNTFEVLAFGAATTLAFVQQPGTTTDGSVITPSLTVRVTDAYTNPVPDASVSITTTDATAISGTLITQTDSSGIATFNNLSITLTGSYTLSATVGALSATSNPFTITSSAVNLSNSGDGTWAFYRPITITNNSASTLTDYQVLLQPFRDSAEPIANLNNTGLAGIWNFSEGTGTATADLSGNNNNGTLVNGPTWTTGRFGNGLQFNGTSNYVEVLDNVSIRPTSEMSIEMWCYVATLGTSSCNIGKHNTAGDTGYLLFFNSDNRFYFQMGDGGGVWPRYNLSSDVISSVGWYHVVGTHDGTNHRIYVNGTQRGSIAGGAIVQNTSNLWMGRNIDAPAIYYPGTIDEVKVYNRVLSAEEIGMRYGSGLVGSWHFSEAITATIAADMSGNSNNGTLTNGAVITSTGRFGNGCSFDGTDDTVQITTANVVNGIGAFTVEVWAKVDNWLKAFCFIDFAGGAGPWHQLEFGTYDRTDGRIKVILPNDASYVFATNMNSLSSPNDWHHYVLTRSGSTLSLYRDGVFIESIAGNSTVMGASSVNYQWIGAAYNGAVYFYDGLLDEIRLYNRALSANEIATRYNSGVPRVKHDYSDIRFTNSTNTQELAYWQETDNRFWVKIPSIPTSQSAIRIWYGNISATASSNGTNTFDFFDDFSGDLSKWYQTSAIWSITDGVLKSGNVGNPGASLYLRTLNTISNINSTETIFRGLYRDTSADPGTRRLAFGSGADSTPLYTGHDLNVLFGTVANTIYWDYNDLAPISIATTEGVWYKLKSLRYSAGTSRFGVYTGGTDTLLAEKTDTVLRGSGSYLAFGIPFCNMDVDWILVRKYASPEPTALFPGLAPNAPPAPFVDGQLTPVANMTDPTPEFSAVFSDTDWANMALSYEIELGTDDNWANGAEMWDPVPATMPATPVNSRSPDIYYNGTALALNTTYYWRLRFWDDTGLASAWSATQQFTTGSFFDISFTNDGGGNWSQGYYRPITITNSSTAITDYQIPITPFTDSSFLNNTGLVGSWHFSEDSGTSAADMSGNGNNGTLTNGAVITTTGRFGNAISFDGTNDYVNCGNAATLNNTGNQITVETWIKTTDSNATERLLVGKHQSGSAVGYFLELWTDGRAAFWTSAGQNRTIGTVAVNDGLWHHIVGVYDGVNRYIYVDGALQNSMAQTGNLVSTSRPVEMGGNSTLGSAYLNGSLDEPRIYNRALSAAEIATRYNTDAPKVKGDYADIRFTNSAGTAELDYWQETDNRFWVKIPSIPTSQSAIRIWYGNISATASSSYENTRSTLSYSYQGNTGLTSEWRMEEGTGATANDTSGNANNGVLSPTASGPTWTTGRFGNGLSFDGTDDRVQITTANVVNGIGDFTVEVWAKVDNWLKGFCFIDFAGGAGPWNQLEFGTYDRTDGRIKVSLPNDAYYVFATNMNSLSSPNDWHHYVLTRSGSTLSLYRDGVFIESIAGNSTVMGASSVNYQWIGAAWNGAGYFYDGLLDEMRIYNRAMTQQEIIAHYLGRPYVWPEPTAVVAISEYNASNGALLLSNSFAGTWQFYRPITITNSSTAITDYQIPITPFTDASFLNNTGLVGSWHFSEPTTATTTADMSGSGNNGTLVNGPTWTTGRFGNACSFDGTDDYVSVGNPSNLALQTMTIEAWVRRGSLGTNQVIFAGGANDYAFYFGSSGVLNDLGFGKVAVSQVWSTGTVADTTNWRHVAVTYDGVTARFYIDGAPVGSPAYAAPNFIQSAKAVGIRPDISGTPFNGLIDETRIYNRALTAAEISNRYNANAPKVKGDYSDLRFTNADNTAELAYWQETDNRFWVKVPSIAASPTATTIRMYYGNISATAVSNANNTFIFYTDGNDASNWTGSGATNVGGDLRMQGTIANTMGSFRDFPNISSDVVLEHRTRSAVGSGYAAFLLVDDTSAANRFSFITLPTASVTNMQYYNEAAYVTFYNAQQNLTYYRFRQNLRLSASRVDIYVYSTDGGLLGSAADTLYALGSPVNINQLYMGDISSGAATDMYTSWIFIRKYAAVEPTAGAPGAEQ